MKSLTVAIIGNPNAGKTTIFNELTGSKQKVGNWPGVTVDRKCGFFKTKKHDIELIDLPGVYHLAGAEDGGLDESISLRYLSEESPDVVINVVDAANIERHLYLTMQLLEMGLPLVVALNMNDIAKKQGMTIDCTQIGKALGCPVVCMTATKSKGLADLKAEIDSVVADEKRRPYKDHLPDYLQKAINNWISRSSRGMTVGSSSGSASSCGLTAGFSLIKMLEEGQNASNQLPYQQKLDFVSWRKSNIDPFTEDPDIDIADARYAQISQWMNAFVAKSKQKTYAVTEKIDKVVLNRFLGIPIFLFVMYVMFFFAINFGGVFQDFFDIGGNILFVQTPVLVLSGWLPDWMIAMISSGIGMGLNTVVTFIPVIACMFLFLGLLESSGYMSRAAFVVDRLMQKLGLPGKAFVPMIVGFGCNVPAVMAARTLQNKRDRILTILMTPFMSCGARLAIYAVFTAAFFGENAANVVFSLYLIGVLMAILTGFILRKTLLQGDSSTLVMEMPPYHVPTFRHLWNSTWHRLQSFIKRAGKIIIPVCLLIGALNSISVTGEVNFAGTSKDSLLARAGQIMTPIFHPLGIEDDNWPATVGLVTGTMAKEVVVATLDTLYRQQSNTLESSNNVSIGEEVSEALHSIPDNLLALGNTLVNPVSASAPAHEMSASAFGIMAERFSSNAAAFAYLLFILLYFPCITTLAAMVRELNKGWAIFSLAWTTGLGYGVAVVYYQVATWELHPAYSSIWITSIVWSFFAVIFGLKWAANKYHRGNLTFMQTNNRGVS